MKKVILFILCLFLLLGCKNTKINDEQKKVYDGFKDALVNNGDLVSANIPFEYTLEINQTNDGYLYTVIVNKAKIAMKNIQMMILNPIDLDSEYFLPTIGIFSETDVYMIPNQLNEKNGYLSELKLQGISKDKDFKLNVVVSWKDDHQLNKYEAYFNFNVINGEVVSK